jgi:hypothetical protein
MPAWVHPASVLDVFCLSYVSAVLPVQAYPWAVLIHGWSTTPPLRLSLLLPVSECIHLFTDDAAKFYDPEEHGSMEASGTSAIGPLSPAPGTVTRTISAGLRSSVPSVQTARHESGVAGGDSGRSASAAGIHLAYLLQAASVDMYVWECTDSTHVHIL